MKLLWLSNMAPGPVQKQLGKGVKGGLWMDHVLSDLRKREDLELCILFPGKPGQGELDSRCKWHAFAKKLPQDLLPEQKDLFLQVLRDFAPDVVHIWGTEFGHSLFMLEACKDLGLLDHTVVSLQGLCSTYAGHYLEGIPYEVLSRATFRDRLRHDSMVMQQKVFYERGEFEKKALALSKHVIGRTHWDLACARLLAPQAEYHFCNETLREDFYEGSWSYEGCQKHRIFVSSRAYPIKGFHYVLEALRELKKRYPDVVVAVPGKDPTAASARERLHQDGYARYLETLIRSYGLKDHVEFLGRLSGEQMKQQYCMANVFVLPSTIENSPNSLGEAMLLGVPSVAADVGGVTTMLEHGKEGLVYQSTAPYMLCDCIERIFTMGEEAGTLGENARAHALRTHDPEKNLSDLLTIYGQLQKKG